VTEKKGKGYQVREIESTHRQRHGGGGCGGVWVRLHRIYYGASHNNTLLLKHAVHDLHTPYMFPRVTCTPFPTRVCIYICRLPQLSIYARTHAPSTLSHAHILVQDSLTHTYLYRKYCGAAGNKANLLWQKAHAGCG